jgi:hypothetical protein
MFQPCENFAFDNLHPMHSFVVFFPGERQTGE